MISIGAVYRGPELRGADANRQIMAMTKVLNEIRGPLELGKEPLVNAVFVVPGSLGMADFEGLQFGEYSKKDKAVVVQVAVPAVAVSRAQFTAFLIESLHGANAMAFEFFRQKGESFLLREADRLVSATAQSLK